MKIAKHFLVLVSCTIASTLSAEIAGGQIVQQTGNGQFVELNGSVEFSVGNDNFDTDHLYAFDEAQNRMLETQIEVDVGLDQFIQPGTEVSSHYVFFDSLDGVQIGYVDFEFDIIGIAATQRTLASSDFLAENSVNYISLELRGLETGDYVWIDEDSPNRLWVYWAGSSPGDYIRVITRAAQPLLLM